MRGIRPTELIPTFAVETLHRQASLGQRFQCQRIGLLVLAWAAASRISSKTPLAEVVQQGFGQDTASRVVRAKEKDI